MQLLTQGVVADLINVICKSVRRDAFEIGLLKGEPFNSEDDSLAYVFPEKI
jgi:hypothetical protein